MPRIEAPTVAEHSAMRRRQVVAAAVETLTERGVAGFTPAVVAKRAGIARSSIYQYYPSTEALLAAAIVGMLEGSRDSVAAAMGGGRNPAEKVTAYVRQAFADATSGHGSVSLDLAGVEVPSECRAQVRDLHDQILTPLRQALVDLDVSDPDLTAMLISGLVNSAVSAAAHGAPRDALEQATVAFVLRGLGPADSPNRR